MMAGEPEVHPHLPEIIMRALLLGLPAGNTTTGITCTQAQGLYTDNNPEFFKIL